MIIQELMACYQTLAATKNNFSKPISQLLKSLFFPNFALTKNIDMYKIMIAAGLILFSSFNKPVINKDFSEPPTKQSIHKFKVEALDGSTIDFSQFKGKKILVVNTASKCGSTPQYEALEK